MIMTFCNALHGAHLKWKLVPVRCKCNYVSLYGSDILVKVQTEDLVYFIALTIYNLQLIASA